MYDIICYILYIINNVYYMLYILHMLFLVPGMAYPYFSDWKFDNLVKFVALFTFS